VNLTPLANFFISPPSPDYTAKQLYYLNIATISHLLNVYISLSLNPNSINLFIISPLLNFLKSASVPVTALGFWIAGFKKILLFLALFKESYEIFKGNFKYEYPPCPFDGSPIPSSIIIPFDYLL
jgi:hypothetical protein